MLITLIIAMAVALNKAQVLFRYLQTVPANTLDLKQNPNRKIR
jgi:hypothetical protein